MTKSQIFVVDDHALVRLGMRQLLNGEPDLHVCGEAEDLRGALEKLEDTPTDLVLLDLSLRSGDGLDALKQLRALRPEQRILVLTTHDEKVYGERVIRAGAAGYVMKATPAEEVLNAIRTALRGELAVSPALAASLLFVSQAAQSGSRNAWGVLAVVLALAAWRGRGRSGARRAAGLAVFFAASLYLIPSRPSS